MIGERVPAALDGERLDRIVALLADVSRSAAATAIASRRRARRRRRASRRARCASSEGAVVEVDLDAMPRGGSCRRPTRRSSSTSCTRTTDVIVVDKPAGLVVHPGAGNPAGTLVNGLLARYPGARRRRRSDPPGHRPPSRRRQLGAARRRPHRGGVGRADRAVRRPHRRPALRRRRVGTPRRTARDHRRPDRARSGATRCRWRSSSTAGGRAPSTRCSSASSARPSWPC